MTYLLAVPVVAFVAFLVVGAVAGRVRVRSCCAADPRQDLRMRAAFPDERDGA